MIQLFLFNDGAAVIQYGLRNSAVRAILALEVAAIILGIIIGLFAHIYDKRHVWLLIPGFAGCVLFVFINTIGRTIFSNANIWPPFLAEDLIVFSVISCMAMYLKKRFKQKGE